MTYNIGDIFKNDDDYENKVKWAMENNARIVVYEDKLEEVEKTRVIEKVDENGGISYKEETYTEEVLVRYYQLVKRQAPSLDELKTLKRAERDNMINSYIWRVQRYEQQSKLGGETTDTEEDYLELLNYIQFLRDLPESPDFPNIDILTFDDWQYAKQQAIKENSITDEN